MNAVTGDINDIACSKISKNINKRIKIHPIKFPLVPFHSFNIRIGFLKKNIFYIENNIFIQSFNRKHNKNLTYKHVYFVG